MTDPFAWFWSAMILLSIGWYTVLLFWVGIHGGYEIVRMTRALSRPAWHSSSRDQAG